MRTELLISVGLQSGRLLLFTCVASSIFLVLLHGSSRAMTFSVSGDTVSAIGEIMPGDAARFSEFMSKRSLASDVDRQIVVRLESHGANLAEAMILGEAFRHIGASTIVRRGESCASACFLAFLGGTTVFATGRGGDWQGRGVWRAVEFQWHYCGYRKNYVLKRPC